MSFKLKKYEISSYIFFIITPAAVKLVVGLVYNLLLKNFYIY